VGQRVFASLPIKNPINYRLDPIYNPQNHLHGIVNSLNPKMIIIIGIQIQKIYSNGKIKSLNAKIVPTISIFS